MRSNDAYMIIDLQYGSTGKGLMAGYMAETYEPDVVMHAWGPNAGHTYINRDGRKFIHCMLHNGIVSPKFKYGLIGPGACVSLPILVKEMENSIDLLMGKEILIHPHAAIVQDRHIIAEGGNMVGIGSTRKGTGAALIEKILRQPQGDIVAYSFKDKVEMLANEYGIPMKVCTQSEYNMIVDGAKLIQVEGSQGYSLGISSGFYPYTTSRECTPAQLASDVLLPLPTIRQIVGCMRTYPIRVANRYDEQGAMVGWSGPCYPDQVEISFEAIGQSQELTTVTKLPRRLFTFSRMQTADALRQTRPTDVVIGFANYCKSQSELGDIIDVVDNYAKHFGCGGVSWITVGPTFNDVKEFL